MAKDRKYINPDDEGFLAWLDRPGRGVRALLAGDPGQLLRQGVDAGTDVLDAFLPGDMIPNLTTPDEAISGADLLEQYGVNEMEPGWKRTIADIAVGTATDPLTYVGAGPLIKGGKAAIGAGANLLSKFERGAQAVKALEGAGTAVKQFAKSATGSMKPSKETAEQIAAATSKGGATSQAAQGFAVPLFKGLSKDVHEKAEGLVRNFYKDPVDKAWKPIDETFQIPARTGAFSSLDDQIKRIDARLAMLPWDEATKQAARKAAIDATTFTRGQYSGALRDKVLGTPEGLTEGLAPHDYLPGAYDLEEAAARNPDLHLMEGSTPNFLKEKSLKTGEDIAKFLNETKAAPVGNLSKTLGDYGQRMGSAVKSAEIGKSLIGDKFKSLADPASRAAVNEGIANLQKAGRLDDAEVLKVAFSGLPPRGQFMALLAKYNQKLFKPFATAGALGIPRPAFNVRNAFSSAAQVLSNPESRGAALGQLGRVPGNIWDGLSAYLRKMGVPLGTPAAEKDIAQALTASGGDRVRFLAAIKDPELKLAVEHGVLNSGFGSSELLIAKQDAGRLRQAMNAPQEWTNATENSMRIGLFKQLLKDHGPARAAQLVKDDLYDYAQSSVANRTLRDVIPFFQFTAKAVPQQAAFLAERGIAGGLARQTVLNLYGANEDKVLPPQMQNTPAIPVGRDEEGNPKYLTSLGLPFEALSQIPNPGEGIMGFGKDLRQKVVSATNPALKAAYTYVSGEDPYFGTPFASYDKAPFLAQKLGADEKSGMARIYNVLAGSGAIQPISTPIQTISGTLDPRRTGLETALNTLTGARIKSVDEEQATRQLLEEALKKNPDIQRYETLYANSTDPDTQELLQELKRIKADISKRRKAEKAALAQ